MLGAIGAAAIGAWSAKQTNKANRTNANIANDFTREQMQKRHQWEVADLRAAGLNPVLSAGGTPSMGSSAKADVINPSDSAAAAANSAANVKLIHEKIKNIRETNQNIKQDTQLKRANTATARANAEIAKNQIPSSKNSANASNTWWGRNIAPYLNDLSKISGAFGNSAKAIGSLAK